MEVGGSRLQMIMINMIMIPLMHQPDPDAAIRQTDLDASQSRLSAVRTSYMEDPFIRFLVPRGFAAPARPPLINVGTFVRSEAIDRLIAGWLELDSDMKEKQIVSMGAGSDTRFWRLASGELKDRIGKYLEIDFPEITSKKAMTIKKHKELNDLVGDNPHVTGGGTGLTSSIYSLQPADLRKKPSEIFTSLLESGIISPELPTLFIAECVFVYLAPAVTSSLINYFTNTFSNGCAGLVYEMFGLGTKFGRVMRDNLRARGIELLGAEEATALESQTRRFEEAGMTSAKSLTLKSVRKEYIGGAELKRVSRLELLDEIEELDLMLSHYVISWAVSPPATHKEAWTSWGLPKPA